MEEPDANLINPLLRNSKDLSLTLHLSRRHLARGMVSIRVSHENWPFVSSIWLIELSLVKNLKYLKVDWQ